MFFNLFPIFNPLEKSHRAPIKCKKMSITAHDTEIESRSQTHLKARERDKTNIQMTKILLGKKETNILYKNIMPFCFQKRHG